MEAADVTVGRKLPQRDQANTNSKKHTVQRLPLASPYNVSPPSSHPLSPLPIFIFLSLLSPGSPPGNYNLPRSTTGDPPFSLQHLLHSRKQSRLAILTVPSHSSHNHQRPDPSPIFIRLALRPPLCRTLSRYLDTLRYRDSMKIQQIIVRVGLNQLLSSEIIEFFIGTIIAFPFLGIVCSRTSH